MKTLFKGGLIYDGTGRRPFTGDVLIEDDCIDAAAVAEEAVVLDMDLVYLCRPDCKGLCPKCGFRLFFR